MRKKLQAALTFTPTFTVICVLLLAGVLFSLLAAVTFGTVKIPLRDVYGVVLYKLFGVGDAAYGSGAEHDVVWLLRLPRLVLAVGVGMALSVSGLVMQAVVKNPLADPYVLGISSGAYTGASMALLLGVGSFLGGNFPGIMAFVGAFVVSLAVIAIASIGGRATSVKLILAGTALSAVCSAFSNFIIYSTYESQKVQMVVNWTMGSLAGASWQRNAVILPIVTLCVLFFWSQFRNLNLMLLGDDAAVTLGTNLSRWRLLYLLASAFMVGFAVYASGMIGFVGLVIPHIMRIFFGTNHKRLVPVCALSGAIFLIWADVFSRVILPQSELPIGIFTSMIGAPCFVYLMVRKRYGFGGEE